MRFSSILLAAVALAGPSYSTALDMRSAKAPTPPDLDYLFTATVDIAVPLPNIPILNNPEGVRVVFPIPSGTIAGPALDATITGGLAYPEFDGKGASAIEVALITIYGNTTDGYPFLAQVLGIGSSKRQSARLQLDIGGNYANLSNDFILATLKPSADRTIVVVDAYKVVF